MVAGIGNTNFDLWAAGRRPQNFYMLGSMGLALPIALGVALAQPRRRVFALEGDGSLLMQIGALVTIGKLKPKNLTMPGDGQRRLPDHRCAEHRCLWLGRFRRHGARGPGLVKTVFGRPTKANFEELVDAALSSDGPDLHRRAHRHQAGCRDHRA